MESLFEEQRRLHEERERLTDTMMREWLHEKKTHKERINSDQRLKLLLERHNLKSSRLIRLYEDADGARRDENTSIGGPNEFAEFYNRLKHVKDTHRLHPDEVAVPLSMEYEQMNEMIDNPDRVEVDMVTFTDEEGYGKFLDLNKQFLLFINLKNVQRIDYVSYLQKFDQLYDIPKDAKKAGDYRKYVESLLDYFLDFLRRVKPLMDVREERTKCLEQFERQWKDRTFAGWSDKDTTTPHSALAHTGAHLDLSPFNSAHELETLGLDRLKSALMALGLKCGGTLQERSRRLFATKGKKTEELDPSLLAASAKTASTASSTDSAAEKEQRRQHDLAAVEAQIYYFSEMLSEQRAATKENVERKQARAVGEDYESDEDVHEVVLSDHEEDDDDVPYNPKNLPLGWDGKPIPYWLYKLHGLNINYPCEICGNQVYKGPKAFQRHFSEWRHSHGMRCLGIPNTAHFANVTKIADAIELWQKIRENKEAERFRPEVEEEYEDSVGNVVNKKTFEDLKRQGLL